MNWKDKDLSNIRKLQTALKSLPGNNHSKLLTALIILTAIGIIIGAGGIFAQSQVTITSLEVNQVLGVQKDNNQYYVAGKNTVVRAFFSPAAAIDPANTWVNVSRNNKEVFKIYPKKTTGNVSSVDFLCKNMMSCENWAAGTYAFQPYINGTAGSVSASYEFETGTKIRVLVVPLKANYGSGGAKSLSDEKWKKMGDFMQKVYPLAEGNLFWDPRKTVFDASAAAYDLEKSDWTGCKKLIVDLSNLIPVKCKTSPQNKGCYDVVVGFIKESLTQDDDQDLAGFTYTGFKSIVAVAGDDDAPGTVAHEIAHQYGIGDTYDDEKLSSIRCSVNPAPDGFKGRDWDNFESVASCTDGRKASTLKGKDGKNIINGAQVAVSDHPHEVYGRGALTEMADFMSAGGAWQSQMWITKDNYDWLFRRLVKQQSEKDILGMVKAASATPQRFVSFSGSLSKTGAVELNPWKSYSDTATLGDTNGPLMVQAVNSAGGVLASTSFTVKFYSMHPPRALTAAPFEGVINFPAGTVKFQIVKDGTVLAEMPVSANEPTVTDVTPKTTTTLACSYTVTWTGNDPDGNKLFYTVEYNPDVTNASSAWMILADELETSSWTQNFSELPGGNHAKIRVTAYDGVLYGEAESAEFVVPLKNPEVFLDDLPWGTNYNAGDDILLLAEAYDPQDEWLPDDKIRWTSNISGELGYGSELLVGNLEAGKHTVTMTATNSAGLSSSATVEVQVGSSAGSGHCFIATAAFGSYMHPYVSLLRNFRDAYLLTNRTGRAFVDWYYRVSLPLASWIADRETMQAAVRILLLPAIAFSALAINIGLFWSVLILLAFLLLAGFAGRKLVQSARRRI